jgi:hypothetical protein
VDRGAEIRPDPLASHGFPSVWERGFVTGLRRAITVPVLALESPQSPTPRGERDARIDSYAGPSSWASVDAGPTLAAAVTAALADRPGWWG